MNKVILMGRTTTEIELKSSNDGKDYARFGIAVNRDYVKGGKSEADFFNCVAFGTTAKNLSQYITKGSRIIIEGKVQINSYENSDGEKVKSTSIVVERTSFIDSKSEPSKSSNKTNNATEDEEDEFFPF